MIANRHPELGAVILCGGKSLRMGSPKAWLPFGNELLLPRVVRLVDLAVSEVVVVAAPGQHLPALPSHVRVERDARSDRGPLQGLATGLSAMPPHTIFSFAWATDAPYLASKWIACFHTWIGSQDLAIPCVQGIFHPLAAMYCVSPALQAMNCALIENRLKLTDLVSSLDARVIDEQTLRAIDPDLQTLQNLNTRVEYECALRSL